MAFGLILVESYLDKLSSWNQGVIAHFLEKVEPSKIVIMAPPLAQVFYSQSAYQINSVKTINTGVQYHSENYKQGFNWDQITEFVLKNLNTDMAENPLIEIFNKIVDSYKKKIPSEFGVMKLDYGKFNISLQLQPFGKYFEPELLKFFKICGSMMQAQCRWWNSGLLYGQLANRGKLNMEVKCPLAQLHNSCVGLK